MKIVGIEKLESLSPKIGFPEFSNVQKLSLAISNRSTALDYEARTEQCAPQLEIGLRFTGVRSFSFETAAGPAMQVTGIDITDISDWSWENLNWEVSDDEQNNLHFYAETAEIIFVREI